MTLDTSVQRVDYVGTGTTGPFAYGFRILAATDLEVTTDDGAGHVTTLAYPTDYTVTGAGARGGGTVTLTTALTAGWHLTIRRVRPATQTTNFRNLGAFFPEQHEDALDHLVMLHQQLRDDVDRSFKVPVTVPAAQVSPTIGTFLPDHYLRVTLDGTGLEGVPAVASSQSFLQSGTGAVSRTMNAKAGEFVAVTDFGALPDDATDNTPLFADAIAAGASGHWVPAGTYRFNTDTTLDTQLTVMPGAVVKPANGVTVTLAGRVTAGMQQWIDLSLGGSVVFAPGAVERALPHWWGAKGDGVAVDTGATQRAIASLGASGGGRLFHPAGTYVIDAQLTGADHVAIEGAGQDITTILCTNATPNVDWLRLYNGQAVRDLTVVGPWDGVSAVPSFPPAKVGLRCEYLGATLNARGTADVDWHGARCLIEHVTVRNWPQDGMILGPHTTVRHCRVTNNYNEGILVIGDYCRLEGNYVADNLNWGIDFNTNYSTAVGNWVVRCGSATSPAWPDGGGMIIAAFATMGPSSYNTFAGNVVDTTDGMGIHLTGQDATDCVGNRLLDNTIRNACQNFPDLTAGGIGIYNSNGNAAYPVRDTVIRGNRVTGSGMVGISCRATQRTRCEGNTIDGTAREGLLVASAPANGRPDTEGRYTGNTVRNFPRQGIYVHDSDHVTVDGNDVAAKLTTVAGQEDVPLLLLETVTDFTIRANRVQGLNDGVRRNAGISVYGISARGHVSDNLATQCWVGIEGSALTNDPATKTITITGNTLTENLGQDLVGPTFAVTRFVVRDNATDLGTRGALTDAATVTPNLNSGADLFHLGASLGARTLAVPIGASPGRRFTLVLSNDSGGATTTTFAAGYALAGAWTDPASGKVRTIAFVYDDVMSKWVETSRAAADI